MIRSNSMKVVSQLAQLVKCVCVLALVIHLASSESDACKQHTTCGACIQTPKCVWCSQPDDGVTSLPFPRCQQKSSVNNCPAESIVDPLPEFQVIEDRKSLGFTDVNIPSQLRPQRVSLKNLRIGESYNISVQFTPAKNYPLDLYLLMDVSSSMIDDKQNVEKLGVTLAATMRNITSNFKLGFGSFVDKNVIPFVDYTGDYCYNDNGVVFCEKTYSFKHRLKLNQNNEEAFVAEVKNATIVVTRDLPEGGLDGLIQTIVCDQIGWSDRSRRLIVFVTDAVSHIAGHGKIGGIVAPNDGKCHLDNRGNYTVPLQQDYPSLGQLSRLAKDNSINLIFAVTNQVSYSYAVLSNSIKGSSVGILANDSRNIVELIKQQYNTISSSVQLKAATTTAVGVRFFTSCNGATVQERDKCTNLVDGRATSFTVNIEAKECPRNGKQFITIYPVGVNESLTVELDIVCDCPCERPGNPGFQQNSTYCNSGGDQVCGVCACDQEHSGRRCECSGDVDYSELEFQCKADNQSQVLCSGQGTCICGKCQCTTRPNPSEIISGQFCECDNFSCPRGNGKVCSGNGECRCGRCDCNEGWTGSACDCRSSNDPCMPFGGDEYCSGNGFCSCGTCQCQSGATGRFCEDCPTCPDRCPEFIPCVQCKMFGNGPYTNETGLCQRKCNFPVVPVSELQIEASHERTCWYEVEDQCRVLFIYGFAENGGKRVRVLNHLICPEPVPVLAISLGVLLALLLLGILAILLYRLYTYVQDRREYARFEEEKKKARWSAEKSPLYITPIQQTRNPMFGALS